MSDARDKTEHSNFFSYYFSTIFYFQQSGAVKILTFAEEDTNNIHFQYSQCFFCLSSY